MNRFLLYSSYYQHVQLPTGILGLKGSIQQQEINMCGRNKKTLLEISIGDEASDTIKSDIYLTLH